MSERLKRHFKENRKVYIAVGATSVIVAGITFIIVRERCADMRGVSDGSSTAESSVATRSFTIMRDHSRPIRVAVGEPAQGAVGVLGEKVKIKNSTLNVVSYVSSERQGPPSWIVRCKETGDIFTSQKAASIEMGLSQAHISLHLNGKMDHVRGFTFERIAMAA